MEVNSFTKPIEMNIFDIFIVTKKPIVVDIGCQ